MPHLVHRAHLLARDLVALSRCLVLSVLSLAFLGLCAGAASGQTVLVNEIHYDNTGTDAGEAIEVAAPGGTDLAGWSLVLYNGAGGASYNTLALTGIVPVQEGGFGVLSFTYPVNGIQNGAPDGVALVDPSTVVVEFLSYEGAFTAVGGPANGLLSTDIGVAEAGTEPLGQSLQRIGDGDDASEFVWTGPATASFGLPNDGQSFGGAAADPLLNELVAAHTGTDTNEFVEVFGDSDTDYSAFTVLQVEGDSTAAGVVDSVHVVGTTSADGYWTSGFLTNVLENGTITLVLVEGFTGAVGVDLDVENDGLLDAALPWDRAVDCVAVTDGGADDRSYCSIVLAPGFDGDAFLPGGASRIPNATDTDSAADWRRNDFDGEGLPGFPTGTTEFPEAFNTQAASNDAPPPPPPDTPELVINEIDYDQPGTDAAEFVEIRNVGTEPVDLDPVELVFVNGTGGALYDTVDLPSFVLDPGEHYVVCANAANTPSCDLDDGPDTNFLQNGAPDAVALVLGTALIDAVSYEGDNAAPYTEGSGAGLEDSGAADHVGISRFPDGVDTGVNNVDLSPRCITPGEANVPASTSCPPPSGGATVTAEIFEIQGAGLVSPLAGQNVETLDNVVTALASDGFFVQTPDVRADADVTTSNGIFVFTGSAPTVLVGDVVDVRGTASEFFGFTEISGAVAVTVDSSGAALPAPVSFDAATPSPDQPVSPTGFERFEAMRIAVAAGVVGGPNQRFGTDPLAEVQITATGQRAFREPGILFPGLPGLPVWDGNPEVFELDPDRLGLPNLEIPAGSTFSAEGVLGFEFNGWELWPTALSVDAAPLPVPVRDRATGEHAEYTIGSANLFRLFDSVDDPGIPATHCGSGFRDEDSDEVLSPAVYQRRLGKLARYIVEVLGAPDVLAVSEAEKLGVLGDLAAEIALLDPSVVYTGYLVEGHDCGSIDTGFLVRDTVDVLEVVQLGFDETLSVDGTPLHDRPPLLLTGEYTTAGPSLPFGVVALHQRSLGGIEDPSDGPRVRQKRLEQAQSVAAMVQAFQETLPGTPLAVVGDFNAFEFSDGYVDVVGQIAGDVDPAENLLSGPDLVEPNLTNQVVSNPPEERYSFVFGGSAQTLDHALTNEALAPFVRGLEHGRGNADAALLRIDDETTPLRASDHDGLVLFVETDDDGVPDDQDLCPATAIPESVPERRLLPLHYALVDGDIVFDRGTLGSPHLGSELDLFDTAGCSCEQILEKLHLGKGLRKFGCPLGVMWLWLRVVG